MADSPQRRQVIRDRAVIRSGGTPATDNPDFWGGSVPWVTAKDMKRLYLSDAQLHLTPLGTHSGTRVVPKGSVLVLVRGMTLLKDLPVCVTTREMAFNQDVRALLPKEGVTADYLAHWLLAHKRQILRYVNIAGHGTGRLETEFLEEFPLDLPSHDAQRDIVFILRCAEQECYLVEDLLSAKQRFKRGLMQQLLTGTRRFKEFAGQRWRRCRIGDLFRDISRDIKVEDDTLYRLVSIRRRSGGFFDREPLHGRDIGYTKLKTIRTGDFVIARRQVVHGAMAMATKRFDGALVSDAYATLVPLAPDGISVPFFDFLSRTPRMYHAALRCSYGVAIEKLFFNLEWFLDETITIPPSVEEQAKIARTLEAVDREIALLGRQLVALKEQKKGLMQKLLMGQTRWQACK